MIAVAAAVASVAGVAVAAARITAMVVNQQRTLEKLQQVDRTELQSFMHSPCALEVEQEEIVAARRTCSGGSGYEQKDRVEKCPNYRSSITTTTSRRITITTINQWPPPPAPSTLPTLPTPTSPKPPTSPTSSLCHHLPGFSTGFSQSQTH